MAKVRLSLEESAIVGQNIRALRLARGWTQRHVADLMDWGSSSVVCHAEGRTNAGKRVHRMFTAREVRELSEVFGVTPEKLMTRTCAHCHGLPPAGYACLSCGTKG
jgi:transcriptional regulator with XRE-family HTH domain